MAKVLLPVSALAVYRTVTSNGEIVVANPTVLITKDNGDIKTLYSDRNRSSIVDNPFLAPNSGQWQVWTEPEMEPLRVRIRKGRSENEVSCSLTPSNEMVVSTILPIVVLEVSEGLAANYIGQDYLYQQFNEAGDTVIAERLFKSRSLAIGDWIEINIGTN